MTTSRSFKFVIAALGCAAMLIPVAAVARTHYKVGVSVRYGVDSTLRGKVTSHKGRCRKGVKVVAVNVRTKAVIGTDLTDKKGRWEIFAPGLVDLVKATVGRTGTSLESGVSFVCDRAESPTIAPVDV